MIENATGSAVDLVSQIPVEKWHQVIGHPTLADATCDRIVHSAHRIELNWESIRKLKGRCEGGQEKEPE